MKLLALIGFALVLASTAKVRSLNDNGEDISGEASFVLETVSSQIDQMRIAIFVMF
jgi:hypothetical protein